MQAFMKINKYKHLKNNKIHIMLLFDQAEYFYDINLIIEIHISRYQKEERSSRLNYQKNETKTNIFKEAPSYNLDR